MSRIAIPVILCGRTAAVGRPVSQLLRPDYEVIHFITSPEGAHADLPLLLAGRDPQSTAPNDIGTHNYTQPPRAVIFGRGFTPDFVQELKKAYADRSQEPVAWVAGDPAKVPTGIPGPGYAEVYRGTSETG
ncbi:hypothetical protein ASPVEDRAFT_150790 [Aspergillus versicolor CBS 583.65]|uniref:NmrA-like domain-containing protein n=1 Tax=Aspergillus versicolor CBS 583.65 TaxID=1036611 RepID=A0A1L9PKN1_ASPVE|nr:uncharacterized protein ASPVEDRAFT_150790 [Aspergillus versicolor CBS 583.65]OJJ02088.1 hypothetical protein ASPVEDRAFT_150790 [Aspergillus versicolor CBS 583.65]